VGKVGCVLWDVLDYKGGGMWDRWDVCCGMCWNIREVVCGIGGMCVVGCVGM
jgi:hypothetical protein